MPLNRTRASFAGLVLLVCACSSKKPDQPAEEAPVTTIAPVPEGTGGDLGYGDDARLFDSPADALTVILETQPAVVGFGEYHKLNDSAPVRSALDRFANDMFDQLGPKSAHLILETWSVSPKCGKKGKAVESQVQQSIQRPKETESEMATLARKAKSYGVAGHILEFGCDEYDGLLGKEGLNHDRLLETVSRKLGEQALAAHNSASAKDKLVVVYGGATHNDLTPYKGLEAWSYAKDVAAATEGGFVEVDLYVPELVEGDELLAQEAWYPLMKEARDDQVILIRRDSHSYILLMRANLKISP